MRRAAGYDGVSSPCAIPEGPCQVFDAVLVANRGEIAVRVMRACRELGVRTVAVYSEADRDALHVRYADEAFLVGPASAADSYLATEKLLDVAERADVDAIHPGYGFFSENADFAEAVQAAGFVFVGPSPRSIRRMGDKLSARRAALAADAPVVPGTPEPLTDIAAAVAFADDHGYPVAVKAAFGGGGRGMRVVRSEPELRDAVASASREAQAAFGRGEVYLERYLERPRHVEVQVLGDLDGTVIHLGERDCSLQRRHQKLIEEAPAPGVSDALRQRLGAAAVRIAQQVGYHNAGTCEFLLANNGHDFYFLEMNTRLQVEHPVTEFVTGVDLVHAQLRIAAGDGMGLTQDDVSIRGHAIEVRLNAEDPGEGFSPGPGRITRLALPQGPWVRFDGGVEQGWEIPRLYDSMIGKLIVWGGDREEARRRMLRALDELVVEGVPTVAPFHRLALEHHDFVKATHSTVSVEHEWDLSTLERHEAVAATQEPTAAGRTITVEVDGRRLEVTVFGDLGDPAGSGEPSVSDRVRRRASGVGGGQVSAGGADVVAPMQGTLVTYAAAEGDTVAAGDLVAVLEAMKMENHVIAHRDGVVHDLRFFPGDTVPSGAVLARIGDTPAPPDDEADVAEAAG
ncbi:MAG: acetyl-CoA carboxylase biotin carboxylase subunit [Actinobacteria bacterium]|nr:acetyl-CoA carboxylase biotin carboxylase subunit [Actinomycetota bacterium]